MSAPQTILLGYQDGKPVYGQSVDGPRQGLVSYLKDTARSFDPRTRAGALSLAAAFVPGSFGRGSRLTPIQQAFLDQLKLPVKVVRHQGMGGPGTQLAAYFKQNTDPPLYSRNNPEGMHFSLADVVNNPHLAPMAEKMGFTTGMTVRDLMFPSRLSNKGVLGSQGMRPIENIKPSVPSRLGIAPDAGMSHGTLNIARRLGQSRPVSPYVIGGKYGLGNQIESPSMNMLLNLLNKSAINRRN